MLVVGLVWVFGCHNLSLVSHSDLKAPHSAIRKGITQHGMMPRWVDLDAYICNALYWCKLFGVAANQIQATLPMRSSNL